MRIRYIVINYVRKSIGLEPIWSGSASRRTVMKIGEVKLGRKKRPFELLSKYRKEILHSMTNIKP